VSEDECKLSEGIVIEEADGKKVAKQLLTLPAISRVERATSS
jgi:hypothetical protein